MKPLGLLTAAALLAAFPIEAVAYAFALFWLTVASIFGLQLRRAVKRLDASVAELAARLPDER